MKGVLSKRIAFKVDALWDRKIYCLQARTCIFSPEILQAGAVRGLMSTQPTSPALALTEEAVGNEYNKAYALSVNTRDESL